MLTVEINIHNAIKLGSVERDSFNSLEKRRVDLFISGLIILFSMGHMVGHMGSGGAYGVRSFVIIFLKSFRNNINFKCDNKRPAPCLRLNPIIVNWA